MEREAGDSRSRNQGSGEVKGVPFLFVYYFSLNEFCLPFFLFFFCLLYVFLSARMSLPLKMPSPVDTNLCIPAIFSLNGAPKSRQTQTTALKDTLRNQTFRLAGAETKSRKGSNKRFDTTEMISSDGRTKLARTRQDPVSSISGQRTCRPDSFMILIACDNRMHVLGPSPTEGLAHHDFYGLR